MHIIHCFKRTVRLLTDDVRNATIRGTGNVRFEGSGNPSECLKHINDIVYKAQHVHKCLPKPCAIGTVYQPAVDPSMDYFALSSVFKFTFDTINASRRDDDRFCLNDTREAAFTFCSLVWMHFWYKSARIVFYWHLSSCTTNWQNQRTALSCPAW